MASHTLDDLDLGAIELFLGAVELGSVSKAAARVGLSQPSATARLAKLERHLGIGLLERGPTGSVPTDAGAATIAACTELLASARHLVDLANDRRMANDTVRLAATRTALDLILATRLGARRLQAAHLDDVVLEVSELDTLGVASAVRDGRAAVGVCDGPFAPLGLRSDIIATIELAVVVAPGHPLARRRAKAVRASDVATADLVLRAPGSGTRDVIEAALAPHGFDAIARRAEVPSNAAARLCAVNGSGVALLPIEQVVSDIDAGRLVRVPLGELTVEQPVRVVWKGTQPATEAARRLRSCLSAR